MKRVAGELGDTRILARAGLAVVQSSPGGGWICLYGLALAATLKRVGLTEGVQLWRGVKARGTKEGESNDDDPEELRHGKPHGGLQIQQGVKGGLSAVN